MKRIAPSVYEYKGYTVDGQDAKEIDWRISKEHEWVITFKTKRECKEWIDTWGDWYVSTPTYDPSADVPIPTESHITESTQTTTRE